MPNKIDLTGKLFSRLTVTGIAPKKYGKIYWYCLCDCGNIKEVQSSNLIQGNVSSCGCFRDEQTSEALTVHGMSHKAAEHNVWTLMLGRCNNPNNKSYKNYGGRGIKVCDRWSEYNGKGFMNFISDIGERPSPKHTLERINVNGNYEPLNCTWILKENQNHNKVNTIYVWFKNELKPLALVLKHIGVNRKTYDSRRTYLGITHQEAFNYYALPKTSLIPHSFGYIT